jgi:hypothetical protein
MKWIALQVELFISSLFNDQIIYHKSLFRFWNFGSITKKEMYSFVFQVFKAGRRVTKCLGPSSWTGVLTWVVLTQTLFVIYFLLYLLLCDSNLSLNSIFNI